MRYRVLINYGAYEGWNFKGDEFDSVDAAVKHAISESYGSEFLIVNVIDWKASQANEHTAQLTHHP